MTQSFSVWLMIALTAAGSFATRASFFLVVRDTSRLTPRIRLALSLVPPAAFAALVAPIIFKPGGELEVFTSEVTTALAALALGYVTRSLALTIFAGLALYAVLRYIVL